VQKLTRKLSLQEVTEIARLLDRDEVDLDKNLIAPLWFPELLIQISVLLRRAVGSKAISEYVQNQGFITYSRQAAQIIQKTEAKLYHYRSGFGHQSVQLAKQKGMITLCDHTIAHPSVLQFLIDNQGKMPGAAQHLYIDRLWAKILEDVNQADHVVVNSDFVKQTFINQGWNPERVHVVYLGVDQKFFQTVPIRQHHTLDKTQPIKLLFAGLFGARKGAKVLIQALMALTDLPWQLEIVGEIEPVIAEKYREFLSSPDIKHIGIVPRDRLAQYMVNANVFIFPSLAEGSARVIFEALACGCFIITTPNSGSIVQHNISGLIVPPGDPTALENAIRQVINTDRSQIATVGHQNAELVRQNYQQSNYGDALCNLYNQFL
jgi:glycosyltransferase involved in cell wall biosynthesis